MVPLPGRKREEKEATPLTPGDTLFKATLLSPWEDRKVVKGEGCNGLAYRGLQAYKAEKVVWGGRI